MQLEDIESLESQIGVITGAVSEMQETIDGQEERSRSVRLIDAHMREFSEALDALQGTIKQARAAVEL